MLGMGTKNKTTLRDNRFAGQSACGCPCSHCITKKSIGRIIGLLMRESTKAVLIDRASGAMWLTNKSY